MDISAVIFDLDGVLVFTDKYHYLAWKEIADELGIPFDEEKNNLLRGVSRRESLEIILRDYKGTPLSEDQINEYMEKKNKIYRKMLGKMTHDDVTNEVRNTLKALKSLGFKTAIGSSSKNTPYILEKVGLDQEFDAVSDGNNITRSKPDPEVFLKAAEFLDTDPSKCLIVEDAEAGIDAGLAAGMYTAAIGDAVNCKKSHYSLITFSDLIGICKADR